MPRIYLDMSMGEYVEEFGGDVAPIGLAPPNLINLASVDPTLYFYAHVGRL